MVGVIDTGKDAGDGNLVERGLGALQYGRYWQDGYLHVPGAFSQVEATVLRTALGSLLRHPPNGLLLRREPGLEVGTAFNPGRVWMIEDMVRAGQPWCTLAADPRIVDLIAGAIGPNLDFFNMFARIKPRGNVSHLSWHQDFPHDRHDSPDMATVIVYLDDTDGGTAAIGVSPGSHKAELPHDEFLSVVSDHIPTASVSISARAGDLLLTHPLLVHRAGVNFMMRDRCAILVQAKVAGLRSKIPHRWTMLGQPIARDGRARSLAPLVR